MRTIVCGSRDFTDKDFLFSTLSDIHSERDLSVIIHGCARGADTLAGEWAMENGLIVEEFAAEWTRYGKKAGPKRNERMLRLGMPELVVAFPIDKGKFSGTDHMMSIARKAGVEVLEYRLG